MITQSSQVEQARALVEANGFKLHESASGFWGISVAEPSMYIYYWPVGAYNSVLHSARQRPEAGMSVYTDNISDASKARRDREKAVLAKLSATPSFEEVVQAVLDVKATVAN